MYMHGYIVHLVLVLLNVEPLVSQSPTSGYCPEDWLEFGRSCYFISKDLRSWYDAANICRAFKSELVVIESQEENQFLTNEIRKHGNEYGTSIYTSHFWLDGSDLIQEGHWIWASTLDKWEYTNWSQGEPNGGTGENCLEFGSHWNFRWNDAACGDKKHFICEQSVYFRV